VRGNIELRDLLEKAEAMKSALHIQLDGTQSNGVSYVMDVVRRGGMSVGVGPPGTGKTVIFNFAQREVFDRLSKDEVVIYVAPTNRLVEECATRTLAHLLARGLTWPELMGLVRVYGSRFKAEPLREGVKLVFTTPYQPGALRSLVKMKDAVHLMVDEASTTTLHEPFIEIAMSMVEAIKERRLGWLRSFSVIGDPMQAVTEEYGSWKEKLKLLIVGRILKTSIPQDEEAIIEEDPSKIFELAERYAPSLGVKYFFLENTYRMPKPTELLVSEPFYGGLLKGVESYEQRLKDVKREQPSLVSSVLGSCKLLKDEARKAIDNALDSRIPIVYLRDSGPAYAYTVQEGLIGRRPREIEELDIVRSGLACEVAAYLLASTAPRTWVEVLTPYVEMKAQIQLGLRRLVRGGLEEELRRRVRVSTIHSALGSEADIVVVAMGKEYKGVDEETMYFRIPELINVQFSRHRRLLVIIGNVERLARGFEKVGHAKNLPRLAEALNELKEEELVVRAKVG
jgi:hypothetical protein